ncbi:MAG: hypothetical protein J7J94_00360, partial [Thaumarchaeota archaeon]|nr:hypothetical protein [Nitrososphaerota archaeon]
CVFLLSGEMRVIVASKADPTSIEIAKRIIEIHGFQEIGPDLYRRREILLKLIEEKHIYRDGLCEELNPELAIVASAHKSEAGIRALLTHPVGNWGNEAAAGGRPRTLSPTSAAALYTSLHALQKQASELKLDEWRVGLEVTHHGPATKTPLIFVEAGGPPDELPEEKALEAVAQACVEVAESRLSAPDAAIGFGGGHYAPSFTRLALNGEYALGHMCPKYAMPVDREMIIQALEKTVEKPRIAVLDWKGLKSDMRRELINVLEDLSVEWIRA